MINLNLISAEQRYRLEQVRQRFVCEKLFLFLLLLLFIIGLGLGFSKYLLLSNFQDLVSYNANEKFGGLSKEIIEFNNKLKLINKIQTDFSPVAQKLAFFVKIVPENIFITNFKMEKKDSFWLVLINGRAKSRDDLMVFQANLNQSNGFSEVEFPLSNLLQKKDLDFQFTAKLVDMRP
jgi:Tfp pilus assembly protein PilN